MSHNATSTLGSAVTTTTSGDEPTFSPLVAVKPKRGLGSYKLKQEKFTEKKNIQGKAAFKDRIRQDFKRLNVDILSDDEFLKSLMMGEEVYRPPLEVTVGLSVIPELSQATVDYLATQKVQIEENDVAMLEQVTTLQIRAKGQNVSFRSVS